MFKKKPSKVMRWQGPAGQVYETEAEAMYAWVDAELEDFMDQAAVHSYGKVVFESEADFVDFLWTNRVTFKAYFEAKRNFGGL